MHSVSLGSGSHSPFSIHVVVLGPMSTSPGGHVKLKMLPSVTGNASTDISLKVFVKFEKTRCPQFAIGFQNMNS